MNDNKNDDSLHIIPVSHSLGLCSADDIAMTRQLWGDHVKSDI